MSSEALGPKPVTRELVQSSAIDTKLATSAKVNEGNSTDEKISHLSKDIESLSSKLTQLKNLKTEYELYNKGEGAPSAERLERIKKIDPAILDKHISQLEANMGQIIHKIKDLQATKHLQHAEASQPKNMTDELNDISHKITQLENMKKDYKLFTEGKTSFPPEVSRAFSQLKPELIDVKFTQLHQEMAKVVDKYKDEAVAVMIEVSTDEIYETNMVRYNTVEALRGEIKKPLNEQNKDEIKRLTSQFNELSSKITQLKKEVADVQVAARGVPSVSTGSSISRRSLSDSIKSGARTLKRKLEEGSSNIVKRMRPNRSEKSEQAAVAEASPLTTATTSSRSRIVSAEATSLTSPSTKSRVVSKEDIASYKDNMKERLSKLDAEVIELRERIKKKENDLKGVKGDKELIKSQIKTLQETIDKREILKPIMKAAAKLPGLQITNEPERVANFIESLDRKIEKDQHRLAQEEANYAESPNDETKQLIMSLKGALEKKIAVRAAILEKGAEVLAYSKFSPDILDIKDLIPGEVAKGEIIEQGFSDQIKNLMSKALKEGTPEWDNYENKRMQILEAFSNAKAEVQERLAHPELWAMRINSKNELEINPYDVVNKIMEPQKANTDVTIPPFVKSFHTEIIRGKLIDVPPALKGNERDAYILKQLSLFSNGDELKALYAKMDDSATTPGNYMDLASQFIDLYNASILVAPQFPPIQPPGSKANI